MIPPTCAEQAASRCQSSCAAAVSPSDRTNGPLFVTPLRGLLRSNYQTLNHCKPIMQVRVTAVCAKGVVMLTSARSLHRSALEHCCHMCQCRVATGTQTAACNTILEALALGTAAFSAAASTRSLRRPTCAHTAGVSNYCQHTPACHSAPPQMSEAAHTGLQPVMRCTLCLQPPRKLRRGLHSTQASLRFSGSAPFRIAASPSVNQRHAFVMDLVHHSGMAQAAMSVGALSAQASCLTLLCLVVDRCLSCFSMSCLLVLL